MQVVLGATCPLTEWPVPATTKRGNTREATLIRVLAQEKCLRDLVEGCNFLQLIWVLLLKVLQVRLSGLLCGFKGAEVVAAAGWCVAVSLVLVSPFANPFESTLVS
jgi:hypothetical protein